MSGPIVELGHLLAFETDVLVAALPDDLLFDIFRPPPRFGLDLVAGRPLQPVARRCRRQCLGPLDQVGVGVVAEDEAHPLVPAVEVLGLGEVGVAAQPDFFEAVCHRIDGPVNPGRRLAGGSIAGTIDQIEGFAGVGQRHDQRVIAPDAVVADVHALLALSRGDRQSAIDVENGFGAKRVRLRSPDLAPSLVDGFLQDLDVIAAWKRRRKSPAVVGSGIRSAARLRV